MQPEEFADLFPVSRETLDKLRIYERLLREWGQTLSLVGRATLDDIWSRHFADSAQLFPLIKGKTPLLDMGSGAGFPGMVLAIMGLRHVHLSDNNQKKTEFLRTVANETATPIVIDNCKAEAVPDTGFTTITARGLASLDELLRLSFRLHGKHTQGLFLKGKSHVEELVAADRDWTYHCDIIPSVTSAESAILRITHLERRKAA